MYTQEEIDRALQVYEQLHSLRKVVKFLGYPGDADGKNGTTHLTYPSSLFHFSKLSEFFLLNQSYSKKHFLY